MKTDKSTQQAASTPLLTQDGHAYEIPEEGSLALLALGYRGLMAWRAKRNQNSGLS